MKITDIKLVKLRTVQEVGTLEPAWDPGGQMAFSEGGGACVQVQTDEGLTGIGPAAAPGVVEAARAHLVRQDPFAVEQHAVTLNYYAKGNPYQGSAGIDIALWDLMGKACGQPLYKLWGGSRDRVPAYASMVRLSTPQERTALARRLADEGWRAIKLRLHHATMAEDLAVVEQVKGAVGDRMEIMVDANQAQSSGTWQPGIQWDFRRALETARELDQLGCYWLEEPLTRYAFEDLARINDEVGLPLAGGENNPGLHEFADMLAGNVYDVLQPESMVLGGITALRKVGVLAETHGKRVAPHHGGRGLGTVAHLHLIASWPHAPYLELLHDPPVGDYRHGFSVLADPPVVGEDGCVAVPQGAGLGVEIDPGLVVAG
jgi:L-alanine-DL-glutamate epimerase-like enolase superfamily enzyme